MNVNPPFSGERESRPGLVLLWFSILAPATAWMLHLSWLYFLTTLKCHQGAGDLVLLMYLSSAALLALAVSGGIAGGRALQSLSAVQDTRFKRGRFMAVSGLISGAFFSVAIIFATVPVVFLEHCNGAA